MTFTATWFDPWKKNFKGLLVWGKLNIFPYRYELVLPPTHSNQNINLIFIRVWWFPFLYRLISRLVAFGIAFVSYITISFRSLFWWIFIEDSLANWVIGYSESEYVWWGCKSLFQHLFYNGFTFFMESSNRFVGCSSPA